MRITSIAVFGAACAVAALAGEGASTNQAFHVGLYGIAEHFTWKETLDGQQLVKESGPLFGAGGALGLRVLEPIWVEGNGEVFLGDVDYDGSIQSSRGTLTPYKSNTQYAGMKLEGDVACKLQLAPAFYLKPYAGAGFRAWRRTLDTEFSDRYIGRHGYVENWLTVYGIVGCGGGLVLGRNSELFGRIEARLPLYNTMTADLTNQGGPTDVELKPGQRASLYAEAGLTVMRLSGTFFVETLEFSQSPLDSKYQVALQPASKATLLGVKLGVAF